MDMEAIRPTLPTKKLVHVVDKTAVKANNAKTGSISCKANLYKLKRPSESDSHLLKLTPFSSSHTLIRQ
jgi:hypothetical protein